MGYFFTNTLSTQKQNNSEYDNAITLWKSKVANNKDGITSDEIKQTLYLSKEPQAVVSIKEDKTAVDHIQNENPIFLYDGTQQGTFLTATYTNLKNSYFIQNGQKVRIAKIVRRFSNLKSLVTPTTIAFWTGTNDQHANSEQLKKTALFVCKDPWYGANFRNATAVTVTDEFYDNLGNKIDPTGGYYIIGSLNYTGNADHESVRGTGVKPMTIAGSSINIQKDGSLMANSSNEVRLSNNGLTVTSTPGNNNWDGTDSSHSDGKYLYYGAGVLKITSSTPSLTFETSGDNPNENIGAQWFQITTDLLANPIQRKTTQTHSHYNTSQAYLLTPL